VVKLRMDALLAVCEMPLLMEPRVPDAQSLSGWAPVAYPPLAMQDTFKHRVLQGLRSLLEVYYFHLFQFQNLNRMVSRMVFHYACKALQMLMSRC
jgi:hypothetical protein